MTDRTSPCFQPFSLIQYFPGIFHITQVSIYTVIQRTICIRPFQRNFSTFPILFCIILITQAGTISTRNDTVTGSKDMILIFIEVVELTTQTVIEKTEIKADIIDFQLCP